MANARTRINHDILIKTILDNDGVIGGGYVRAWVQAGEPVDSGWEDIDCNFNDRRKAINAQSELNKLFLNNPLILDFRWDFTARDLYCNCWYFDGKLKLIEPAKSTILYDELKEMTTNKIAKCIYPFDHVMRRRPLKVITMIDDYGWKILNSDNQELSVEQISKIRKQLISKTTRRIINGKMVEKKIIYNA